AAGRAARPRPRLRGVADQGRRGRRRPPGRRGPAAADRSARRGPGPAEGDPGPRPRADRVSTGTVAGLRTRLITAPLPRPWGPDVPEVHLIVVEVTTTDGRVGTGFSWTPTIGAAAVRALLDHDIADFVTGRPAHPRAVWDDLWAHLHEAGGGG